MADDAERIKAEKVAAARKRVAALQKKKKAGKKAAAESSKTSPPPEPVASPVAHEEEKEEQEEEQAEEQSQAQPESDKPTDDAAQPGEPEETAGDEQVEESAGSADTPVKPSHRRRQPSLSVQSKMRSSTFRQNAGITSPPLPDSDGSSAPELFRKQSVRLDELDKENKRLERELQAADARWKKTEEQLEDLREANADAAQLREKLASAEKKAEEVEQLKSEIATLQRQNSHLQTKHRSAPSVSVADASPSDLASQLESKIAANEAMELEISNLQAQLRSESDRFVSQKEQITALEDKLSRSEAALEKVQQELSDTKHSLSRAAEKAVKEGVDKTSTETLIKSLERQLQEAQNTKTEADKRIETLEKKLDALGNLHKEMEARNQTRLRERDKFEKDVTMLRRKLVTIENENLRLKEERDRVRKHDASATGNDDSLDELEDEERQRLEKRIRELEGENFDLRRGVWKERKRELGAGREEEEFEGPTLTEAGGTFDDVDLSGGLSGPEHARRKSIAQNKQQHSSLATAISSGFAALTGGGMDQKDGTDDFLDDEEFDEDAFARAQAEEEARKRVEWAREIKSKLKEWKGWRLDLVESRYGAQNAGIGYGQIFEA